MWCFGKDSARDTGGYVAPDALSATHRMHLVATAAIYKLRDMQAIVGSEIIIITEAAVRVLRTRLFITTHVYARSINRVWNN